MSSLVFRTKRQTFFSFYHYHVVTDGLGGFMIFFSFLFSADPIYWQPPTTPTGLSNNLTVGVCYYDSTVDKFIVINSKYTEIGYVDNPPPEGYFNYYNYKK